jgi:hypothetical protein
VVRRRYLLRTERALSDGGLYCLSVQLMNKLNIIVVAPLQADLLLSM